MNSPNYTQGENKGDSAPSAAPITPPAPVAAPSVDDIDASIGSALGGFSAPQFSPDDDPEVQLEKQFAEANAQAQAVSRAKDTVTLPIVQQDYIDSVKHAQAIQDSIDSTTQMLNTPPPAPQRPFMTRGEQLASAIALVAGHQNPFAGQAIATAQGHEMDQNAALQNQYQAQAYEYHRQQLLNQLNHQYGQLQQEQQHGYGLQQMEGQTEARLKEIEATGKNARDLYMNKVFDHAQSNYQKALEDPKSTVAARTDAMNALEEMYQNTGGRMGRMFTSYDRQLYSNPTYVQTNKEAQTARYTAAGHYDDQRAQRLADTEQQTIKNLVLTGDYTKAKTAFMDANKTYKDAVTDYTNKRADWLGPINRERMKLMDSEITKNHEGANEAAARVFALTQKGKAPSPNLALGSVMKHMDSLNTLESSGDMLDTEAAGLNSRLEGLKNGSIPPAPGKTSEQEQGDVLKLIQANATRKAYVDSLADRDRTNLGDLASFLPGFKTPSRQRPVNPQTGQPMSDQDLINQAQDSINSHPNDQYAPIKARVILHMWGVRIPQ